jgi:hypothetical protein
MDDRVRVLLMASAPSLEYRFVSALLERREDFELSTWLRSRAPGVPPTGNAPLAEFPSRRETILSYDVVILMDPDPDEFTGQWMESLTELVERHGGGLLWVASRVHAAEFLTRPALSGIRGLLPVVVDEERPGVPPGGAPPSHQGWPVELTPEGRRHQVCRVRDDPEQSEAFWAAAPGLYWTFAAERAKPGATVLLRYKHPAYRTPSGQNGIVAAAQPYGAGRTFFLGCDETWRWRSAGLSEYQHFWVGLARYLAGGRLLGGRKRARLMLESPSYQLGDPVRVRASLLDRDFRPVEAESVELAVEREGARVGSVQMGPLEGEPGVYTGVFYPRQYGTFELVHRLAEGQEVREHFRVERPAEELRDVTLARTALRRIAETSGGSYVRPEELARLPEQLPEAGETIIEPGEPRPLWDRAWLLVALIALLGGEWLLRKGLGAL